MLRIALALALVTPGTAGARKPTAPPPIAPAEAAARLLGAALTSEEPYDELVELCDGIGHRLAGSKALDAAIAWGAEQMREDGLAVRTEPVTVPVWVRGEESLRELSPVPRDIPLLALGRSVGTPEGGIEADVVVVGSWDELAALGEGARGKIVLFDVPFRGYGETVQYRYGAANAASRHGAVAALIRSIGPTGSVTPHTGAMVYDDDVPVRIPVAAISAEDAARMRRLTERGITPRLALALGASVGADAPSANVVGDVVGRARPDEIVLLGCHLDSWDVGQGAQDDGAGCVAVMEAGRLIAAMPNRPRRTVRVVLYTNEESGLAGAMAYAEAHAADEHVVAIEMDVGAGQPLGFRVDARVAASEGFGPGGEDDNAESMRIAAWLERFGPSLAPVGADRFEPGGAGADVGPLVRAGALGLGLDMDTTGYWPVHHTHADTVDKVDEILLRRNVAALAVLAWALADAPELPTVRRLDTP